eukprot:gb/GECH01011262.1/.p1 GENE.gb/GECH01011262.1/~~gb/GECH01011262.1/.p1  ORF type:complete len:136 (+),score=33.30 gb/GECH01011262.1/:1-408(+)
MPTAYLSRREEFAAAHRLYSSKLSEEENIETFGKCVNKHGHNYICEIVVAGQINPTTGMVINIVDLKKAMQKAIMNPLDHQDIDETIEFFSNNPSTAENIAVFIWNQMKQEVGELLYEVRLWETPKNLVTYRGED